MSIVPTNMGDFEQLEEVANLRNQGLSETMVARRLGIPRKVVIQRYDEYKMLLANDGEARDRAMDLLNVMVQQYDDLIKDYYELLGKIRAENFDDKYANQENKALGAIADLIAKRLAAVQQAGLLEATEMGDEYADIEEKANLLLTILRNDICDDCRKKVAQKLQVATNKVEAVVVYPDE